MKIYTNVNNRPNNIDYDVQLLLLLLVFYHLSITVIIITRHIRYNLNTFKNVQCVYNVQR